MTNKGKEGNEVELEEITSVEELKKAEMNGLALVDFGAPWCAPCRLQRPILRQLADQFEGRVLVAAVNVDDFGEASSILGIQSIPTLVFFRYGKEIQRFVGLQSELTLSDALIHLIDSGGSFLEVNDWR